MADARSQQCRPAAMALCLDRSVETHAERHGAGVVCGVADQVLTSEHEPAECGHVRLEKGCPTAAMASPTFRSRRTEHVPGVPPMRWGAVAGQWGGVGQPAKNHVEDGELVVDSAVADRQSDVPAKLAHVNMSKRCARTVTNPWWGARVRPKG